MTSSRDKDGKDHIEEQDLIANCYRKGYSWIEWKCWGSAPNSLQKTNLNSLKANQEMDKVSLLISQGYIRISSPFIIPLAIEGEIAKYWKPICYSYKIVWRYDCDYSTSWYPRTPCTSDEDAPDWIEDIE